MDRDNGLPPVQELLVTLPLATAVLDRELRVVAVNEPWCDTFQQREAVGRKLGDLFPIGERARQILEQALEGETVRGKTDAFRGDGGKTEDFDWTIAPWRDDRGEVGGIVIHSRRVTGQREIELRLREERAFVQAMFEKSPVGMNLCRMDGLWIESNPAFLEIIGYSHEEADGGLTYWALTPREYDEAEQQQLNELEAIGRYGPYDKEFIRKDGTRVPVRLNGFIIEREGENYIWSLIENMTEQRALQDKLEQERLKAVQAAKLASIGELAAGIAHEINNPLQVVDAYAYEIEQAIEHDEPPPVDAARMIRKAATRAARILQGLRKFSRERSSEQSAHHDVALVVDESLALTAARMRNHGVTLEVDVRFQGAVYCSLMELTQVLVNLLNNAFDAVREKRGTVRLIVDSKDGKALFEVEDSGPGVPDDLRDRIFEPFVTSKDVGEGTGLGLSISRGIVQAMGGTLDYLPRDGTSRFVVALPMVEVAS